MSKRVGRNGNGPKRPDTVSNGYALSSRIYDDIFFGNVFKNG